MVENVDTKAKSGLMDLAAKYFKKEGYKVLHEESALEGFSGISRKFDLIVQKDAWSRAFGFATEQDNWSKSDNWLGYGFPDVGLSNPIIVGEKFSDHAKSYSTGGKLRF